MTLDASEMTDAELARELASAEKALRNASCLASDARGDLEDAQHDVRATEERERTAADLARVIEVEVSKRKWAAGFGDLAPFLAEFELERGAPPVCEFDGRWYWLPGPFAAVLPEGCSLDGFKVDQGKAEHVRRWANNTTPVSLDGMKRIEGEGKDARVHIGDARYQRRFVDLVASLDDLTAGVHDHRKSTLLCVWSGPTLVLAVMPVRA